MDTSKNLKKVLYNISEKTGKGAIYIYYSNKGKIKRFPTGIKLAADKWNETECKPKHKALSHDEQAIVDSLYNQVYKLINDYQYEFKELPTVTYIEQNRNKPKEEQDIFKLFEEYVERIKVTNQLTANSVAYYLQCNRRVKEVAKHYKYQLTLDTLNYSFIQLFIEYSRKEKKLSNSTIKQRLDVLKSFVRDLDKHDIKHNINIKKWNKLNKEKIDFICLEKEELEDVKNYTPISKREDKIKDIILFLSHTGMRISDMEFITKENDIDNVLVFKPVKTIRHSIVCKVPISKIVKDILLKYDYKLPTYTGKYLNPYISDFCSKIESLKSKAEDLTSHSVGRKTFINLCVQAGVPLPTICGYTGHSNMDTVMQHYLDKHMNALPQLNKVFEF